MCGPTGIGFLYGKSHLLSTMPPFLGKLLLFLEKLNEKFIYLFIYYYFFNFCVQEFFYV